jgi:proliferating cell nuclear antigen
MRLEINSIEKGEIFSQCFQHMKTFIDSVNISFNEDHMYIQCMDYSMILIMELNFPKEWFDVYEVSSPITIGLMTKIWTKVLTTRDKVQSIRMNTEDKEDHLSVRFHSSVAKNIFDKSFEIPLIDLNTELLNIPEVEYCADICLPTSSFYSMVNELKQFGDVMNVECTEEHINMESESEEFGKMNTFIPIDDLEEYSINENETVKSSFSLRMVSNICLFQKVAKTIQLGLSEQFPMKLQYMMENDASLKFFLAPRIEDS